MINLMDSTDKLPPFPEGWYFISDRKSTRRYCRQFYPEIYPETGGDDLRLSSVTG